MRFKRFKKKRSYRFKVVKMKFQSFVDLSTQADNMQIISVNAGGIDVLKRLSPFFSAYKYYKLGGVSIKLVPASTLPVDPTGLSYEAGEQTVDPRDQLTPGMCRITNGEDILEDISGLTGDQQRELYNNMLLDPRWFKWMLQSGVKRFGKPRYWQIGQLHQDKWPGSVTNVPFVDQAGTSIKGTAIKREVERDSVVSFDGITEYSASSPHGIFQTGHRGVLGWMPCDGLSEVEYVNSADQLLKLKSPLIASVPEVELFKILMPPMHKTNYYYRMFITETVYFKDPVVMNINAYRPVDVFRSVPYPAPMLPNSQAIVPLKPFYDEKTGGNDGSD